jgi:hypothetical protein
MLARYDDLDTRTIALASILSAIVLLILILAGRAVAYSWASVIEDEKYLSAKYQEADQVIADQKAVLKDFATVEQPAQEGQEASSRQVIPIERAMELIGKELVAKPST